MKPMVPLFIVFLLFPFVVSAQIEFEQGYVIADDGKRIECLIKNVDWKLNPSKIKYKTESESEIKTASVDDIQEFGISNEYKFRRFEVRLDTSSDQVGKLSLSRQPLYRTETVFLKVLLEGEASLYQYQIPGMLRFFFSAGSAGLENLVYKQYKVFEEGKSNGGGKIAVNDSYRQQLFNLKCSSLSVRDAENLEYSKKDLLSFFEKYNSCRNAPVTRYGSSKKTQSVHLFIKPGARYASFSMTNPVLSNEDYVFDSKFTPQIGLELAWTLPFNKNKWTLFFEPVYQEFSGEAPKARITYTSIEFSVGVKYHIFLNPETKLFVDAMITKDVILDGEIVQIRASSENSLDMSNAGNFAAGLGGAYKKLSLELRYQGSRDFFNEYALWNSSYKAFNVVLGYRLF